MNNSPEGLSELYKKLVCHFGGQDVTADELNIKQPSVSAWVTGKARMSPVVALRAERKTNQEFKAVDLCPSLGE